jgi:hypothetical protein
LRRQEDIKPGFDAFKEWVETQHKNILTNDSLGQSSSSNDIKGK